MDDNICVTRFLLEQLCVTVASNDSADAKLLFKVFCLLGLANNDGDCKGRMIWVGDETREDGASYVACALTISMCTYME